MVAKFSRAAFHLRRGYLRIICAVRKDGKGVDVMLLSVLIHTHKPLNNTTSLTMWKTLQAN
jgi:hypothetical protein